MPMLQPLKLALDIGSGHGANSVTRLTASVTRSTRLILERHPARFVLGHFGAFGEKVLQFDGL